MVLHPAHSAQFVGREEELVRLRGYLDRARAGRGSIVLLVGEPGIGKTRTARELATEAQRHGVRVLWGRCFESDWPRPYGAWAEALGNYTRTVEPARLRAELGPGLASLVRLMPGRGPALGGGPTLPAPEHERLVLYDAVARLLRLATSEGPVLLVLDDLQWADRDSLALLAYVGRSVTEARLLIVAAYRGEDLAPEHPLTDVLADLAREAVVERLPLRGLSAAAVARYLAAAAGQAVPERLVRLLHTETQGNPFYLREVVRHLQEEARLAGAGPDWVTREPGRLGVPDGVRYVVRRRVARLSEGTRAVLPIMAAFPGGCELRVLRLLTERPPEALLDALEEAQRAGLVRDVGGRGVLFRFAHAIVRHALYEELSAGARVRLHRQIGEVLERLYGADPGPRLAELAFHFGRAVPGGGVERALHYAVLAAERAACLLAYDEAAEHYEQALFLLDQCAPAPAATRRRYDLLLALGEMRWRTGDALSAKQAFVRAAEVGRRLGEPGLLARAAVALPAAIVEGGVVDSTLVGLLEAALASLPLGDSALRAQVLARLAAELYFADVPARRTALSREALAMARRVGDPAALAYVLESSYIALWGPENVAERLAIAHELLQLAEQLGDRNLAALGHGWSIASALEVADLRVVDAAIAAQARLARELRHPFYLFQAAMWAGMRALLAGCFAEAQACARQMLALGQQVRDPDAVLFFACQTLVLRRDLGQLEELAQPLQGLARQYTHVPLFHATLAYLYAELGRESQARSEFERLATNAFTDLPHDLTWLCALALLAETCVFLGDARRGAILYTLLEPYRAYVILMGHGLVCWGAAAHFLGRLAALLDRHQEASEHFEQALAVHTRLGARPLLARTQYEYAKLLLAPRPGRGSRAPAEAERALALLEAALATARELGMPRLAERAAALRYAVASRGSALSWPRAGGAPLVAASPPKPLTRREREVAALVASGLSNREIADELVIAERTVEMHVSNLLAKLGLSSRTQVAVWAVERGLLPPTR